MKWTKSTAWPQDVPTYHSGEVKIGENTLHFTIDKPYRTGWVLRGWENGKYAFYAEDKTMAALKARVEKIVNKELG